MIMRYAEVLLNKAEACYKSSTPDIAAANDAVKAIRARVGLPYDNKEGEELWQVAKRLSCSPERLKENNPDLEFPVKEGQRIFIYRQIQ